MIYKGDYNLMTRGINHIGLTVPDIEIATAFFKEALDGRIAYDSQTKWMNLEVVNLLNMYWDWRMALKSLKRE